MAIKQTFQYCGISIKDGYLKVTEFSGSKSGIGFAVAYKVNAEHDAIKVERFNFVPTMDTNFIAQAYEHLKTLPEFAGARDC